MPIPISICGMGFFSTYRPVLKYYDWPDENKVVNAYSNERSDKEETYQ